MKAKNVFLLSTFLFLVFIVGGQNYKQLVDTNKIWSTINDYNYLLSGGSIQPVSYFTKFSTDTIINGLNYKKILNSNDFSMESWSLIGFIREDTIAKKVFFMNLDNDEGLMHDFNVIVGDTIYLHNPLRSFLDLTSPCIVHSVYQMNINGINYNAIDVMSINDIDGSSKETWIEGIGSLIGLLEIGHKLSGAVGWSYKLLCYFEKDSLLYHCSEYNLCFYSNLNSIISNHVNNNSINIAPNPFITKALITSNKNRITYVEIVDITGNIIKKYKVKASQSFELLRDDLQVGFYLAKVYTDSSLQPTILKFIVN